MRLYRSSIFLLTCFSCVNFYSVQASAAITKVAPEKLQLAQLGSTSTTGQRILEPGSKGSDVRKLQTQLKQLGYYKGVVDGKYALSTKIAVAKFQQANGLNRVDGVTDLTTKQSLANALAPVKPASVATNIDSPVTLATTDSTTSTNSQSAFKDVIWWSTLGLGTLGTCGAILFLLKYFDPNKPQKQSKTFPLKALNPTQEEPVSQVLSELPRTNHYQAETAEVNTSQTSNTSLSTTVLPVETTSRITKLSIVDELIQDLRSPDPKKRQKAIWDLGQQGDSRAIQPLVNLLVDADSQQRNLILAALSEINIRTLKPINKALAISMQDESPQVRQNAIRDLTRVYDMMAQMSQMLVHALDDPDAEVQTTAKYALSQMNRMRNLDKINLPEEIRDSSR